MKNRGAVLTMVLLLILTGGTAVFASKKSSADQESISTTTTEVATTTDAVETSTQEGTTSTASVEPSAPPTITINGDVYWAFQSNGFTVAIPESIKVKSNSKVIYNTTYKNVSIDGDLFETSGDENTVVVIPKQQVKQTSGPKVVLSLTPAPIGKVIHRILTVSPNPTDCYKQEVWINSNGYIHGESTFSGAGGSSGCGTQVEIRGKDPFGPGLADIILSKSNLWAEWLRGTRATAEGLQKYGDGFEIPKYDSVYTNTVTQEIIDRSSLPADFFVPQVPDGYQVNAFGGVG